jgi:holliday junction DNA helicase RuvA
MIAHLNGRLSSKSPTQIVLDVNGIGFEICVPLSTSHRLGDPGTDASVFIQPAFTREGLSFYGFATRDEKDVFNRLTSVKGIGPKAALNLLSRFEPAEINLIIAEKRIATLETVPGIGPKRAASILGRLEDTAQAVTPQDSHIENALSALMSLGLTRREAMSRLDRIPNRSELTLNELLHIALKVADGQ